MSKQIAISFTEAYLQNKAALLADKLNLPLVDIDEQNDEFLLVYTEHYLEIRPKKHNTLGPFHIDFLAGKLGFRRAHTFIKDELLAKAIGVKGNQPLNVIDATAGLGHDSFILACLGCKVTMLERSPIISALLEDGLERLFVKKEYSENINLTLIQEDAIQYINSLDQDNYPDVIYLDPMYPHRTKTALVKKELRIIRELVGDDADAEQLFQSAIEHAKKRVVIKRPRLAPSLASRKVDIVYSGKQHRFDVYLA